MGFATVLLDAALEVIAPTRCAGCDAPGALLCPHCEASLPRVVRATACPSCAAPYGWLVCTECWQQDLEFSAALAVCTLERPISRMITLYKDGSERRLAGLFGATLATLVEDAGWTEWPAAIVAVPATAAARRRRGFDHVRLIAASLSDASGVPLLPALVSCGARDLRRLGREARADATAHAFALADERVPPRILLVDDVLTTGSTLDAAARVLRSGGAEEVRVAVLARAW